MRSHSKQSYEGTSGGLELKSFTSPGNTSEDRKPDSRCSLIGVLVISSKEIKACVNYICVNSIIPNHEI